LLIVAVIIIAVVIISAIYNQSNKKIDDQDSLDKSSIDLPTLAGHHYGNTAFWIYIYEANSDKLDSPVNIPSDVSLIIPDLKSEYGVDITDSMEIKRARGLAEILLKKEIKQIK